MTGQRREVVITGLGVVGPIGIGRQAMAASLAAGHSGIGPITAFDCSRLPVDFGGEVADFDPKRYVRPRKSLKVMSRDIQLGFAAADLALADSGLTIGQPAGAAPADSTSGDSPPPASLAPERVGVLFGADLIYCDLEEVSDAFRSCLVEGRFDFSLWGQRALGQMQPLWMLKLLPNMIACHVGIAHDARGPNNSITQGEVSSLLALTEAARIIERGHADAMIVGGSSSRNHPSAWTFRDDSLLSHRREDPAAACRPFDSGRDGMVTGEGAAAVILEERRAAEARGASVLAAIRGCAATFGPYRLRPASKVTVRDADDLASLGEAIGRGIRLALREAGLSPSDVGHVNANGLSTIDDDRVEAGAIRRVLGDVPVTAPKSYFGNLSAAAGLMELAVTLLALESGHVPVTLNHEQPDPDCPINVVHGQALATGVRSALVLNHSLAGQAVAVAVSKE